MDMTSCPGLSPSFIERAAAITSGKAPFVSPCRLASSKPIPILMSMHNLKAHSATMARLGERYRHGSLECFEFLGVFKTRWKPGFLHGFAHEPVKFCSCGKGHHLMGESAQLRLIIDRTQLQKRIPSSFGSFVNIATALATRIEMERGSRCVISRARAPTASSRFVELAVDMVFECFH